jgi:hypothetical protein
VSSDPVGFLKRIGQRFLGATLWYVPFDAQEAGRPWILWPSRLVHPLPLLALLVLVVKGVRRPLLKVQWLVIGIYVLYLVGQRHFLHAALTEVVGMKQHTAQVDDRGTQDFMRSGSMPSDFSRALRVFV